MDIDEALALQSGARANAQSFPWFRIVVVMMMMMMMMTTMQLVMVLTTARVVMARMMMARGQVDEYVQDDTADGNADATGDDKTWRQFSLR